MARKRKKANRATISRDLSKNAQTVAVATAITKTAQTETTVIAKLKATALHATIKNGLLRAVTAPLATTSKDPVGATAEIANAAKVDFPFVAAARLQGPVLRDPDNNIR